MPRTTSAGKPDANKSVVVDALRACGCSVRDLGGGGGTPDLVVGFDGANFLLEIKHGRNGLNLAQRRFHSEWRGQVSIVRTTADALAVVGIEFQGIRQPENGRGLAATPDPF